MLPCPHRVPQDLCTGADIACWFGPPYNKWYVGQIAEVNKRRTKQMNVTALFLDGGAGEVCVSKEQCGLDKTWVLVGHQIVLDTWGVSQELVLVWRVPLSVI